MFGVYKSIKLWLEGCMDPVGGEYGNTGGNCIPNFGFEIHNSTPDYGSMELDVIEDIELALHKIKVEEIDDKTDSLDPEQTQKKREEGKTRKEISVSNIIDFYGLRFSNLIIFSVCCFIYFNGALQVYQSSLLMPYLKDLWSLNGTQESLIGSVLFIGWIGGTFFWGIVADRYGRVFSLRISITGLMCFSLFTSLATNFYMFIIFRFLTGFFTPSGGMISYLTESIPSSSRGTFLSLVHVPWAVGSCASGVLGLVFLYFADFWETTIPFLHPYSLFIIAGIIPTPFLILSLFILPKSLRFISTKAPQTEEDKEEFDESVRRITKYIEFLNSLNPIFWLFCGCCCWKGPKTPTLSNYEFALPEKTIIKGEEEESGKKKKNGSFRGCCSWSLLVIFFNCVLLYWITSVIYYGIGLTTPSLIGDGLDLSEFLGNIIGSICEMIGVFLPLPLMKYLGRKPALAISYSFVALFMAGTCIIDGFDGPANTNGMSKILIFYSSLTCVMLVRMSTNACFTVGLTLISESLPTKIRSFGIGCGDANSKVWIPIITWMFDILPQMDNLIPKVFFLFVALLGVFSSVIHPVEPKGKNTSD